MNNLDTNRTLVSHFDRANRLKQLDDGSNVTTFKYDAIGYRTEHHAPNGVSTIATFDALNRVKTMLSEKDSGVGVYNLSYKYDLAGNRRSATETVIGHATRNLSWDYDGMYRLVEEKWTGPSAQTRSYEYDRAGNRTMFTIDATASGGSKTYTRFSYDKLNRLNYSTGAHEASYTYDRNGNRISKRESDKTTTYTYDVSNRLLEAKINNVVAFAAAYDARTRRLGKTESGTTTRFRYDGGTNFQELNASGVTTELIRAGGLGGGIGSVLYTDKSMSGGGPKEYFVYNAVGHTVALTDASANPTQTSLYEAFGDTVVKTGASTNNRLANTKERDASIELDNHGFGYYDPETGRYITRDPMGYKDGLNAYHHVGSNPINDVDPLGLDAVREQSGKLLVKLNDLQARKDYDYKANGGKPGPNSEALWKEIQATTKEILNLGQPSAGDYAVAYAKGAAEGAKTGAKAVTNATVDTVASSFSLIGWLLQGLLVFLTLG